MIRTSRRYISSKYAYYDLLLKNTSHPIHPKETTDIKGSGLKPNIERQVFEGNYQSDNLSAEEKISKIFGGRIKGEDRKSSSRFLRGQSRVIGGVTVPDKPVEPDNCCMSGCINCVWELYNDDLKDWKSKRNAAAKQLRLHGGRWPENFDAPVELLGVENLPKSLSGKNITKIKNERKQKKADGWESVPVSIRVFAEMEKKLKSKRKHE